MNAYYICQKEPIGLEYAINSAISFIANKPFVVLLGEDIVYNPNKPCLKHVIEAYDKYNITIFGVTSVALKF